MLNASRFGVFRRSTLSWWRSTRISACKAVGDRNKPTTAHQISLQRSPIPPTINRFVGDRHRVGLAVGTAGHRQIGIDKLDKAGWNGSLPLSLLRAGQFQK